MKHFRQLLILLIALGWVSGVIAETGWWADSKLLATDGAQFDYFGHSVSLSGDRVVVGAFRDDDLGLNSGSAYVFEYDRTNWVQTAKLLAADGAEGEDYDGQEFAGSVSLSGDRVAVGAYGDDDLGYFSGSAYVFRALNVIDPLPDVKINGADGPLTLSDPQEITLSGRLLAGEVVGDVDYWLFAETQEGTFYYVHATGSWVPDMVPAAQGPITDVLVQALQTASDNLPQGTSLIKGGVDLTPNGVLDEPMYMDSLEVTITAPAVFLNSTAFEELRPFRY